MGSGAGRMRPALRGSLRIGLVLGLYLTLPPVYAQLNVIEKTVNRIDNRVVDVQGKVNTIRSRTATILANTNGMQDLVANVSEITAGFRPGLFEDVGQALEDAQALLDLAKDQASEAVENRSNQPDVVALLDAIEDLLRVLLGDAGDTLDLGVLDRLLSILPEQVLAVLGQGLLTAGIDQDVVEKLEQAVVDVDLLQQTDGAESRAASTASAGTPFVAEGSRCDFDRAGWSEASGRVVVLGNFLKLAGKLIAATGKTTASGNITKNIRAGIHGYASLNIENDLSGVIAAILDGVGDAFIALANAASARLDQCEILVYQQTLLDEICTLTRFRSASCQRWDTSAEAEAVRTGP
jgi:uncharacterized protein YoxC